MGSLRTPPSDYDLRRPVNVERLYRDARPDMVIHLAAVVGGIGANKAHPGSFFYENLAMGVELMEQGRQSAVAKWPSSWRWARSAPTPGTRRCRFGGAARLRERGCESICVPRWQEYDLRRAEDVARLYRDARPDLVIHLAAVVGGIGANRAHPGSSVVPKVKRAAGGAGKWRFFARRGLSRRWSSRAGVIARSNSMRIELEQEEDGRWIAEVLDLPGTMVYGHSRDEAIVKAKALALRVVADRLEHGEEIPELSGVFAVPA